MTNVKKCRPFLKWAGGKYAIVHEIRRHLPESDCLIEPFVGAGAVFLNTDYSRYILADINDDLISLYQIVKAQPDNYVSATRELFTLRNNKTDAFYRLRDEFNHAEKKSFRRAMLFLYLNRHCYNGLCRYNASGEFNVPFGRYGKPQFPEEALYLFAEQAQHAEFYCESYRDSMARADKNCAVYCDPPYTPLSDTANFTAYHAGVFTEQDQQALARLAEHLQSENIPVLISNHDTEHTRLWYKKALQHVVGVRRNISGNGKARIKVDELLALYPVDSNSHNDITASLAPFSAMSAAPAPPVTSQPENTIMEKAS